MKGEKKTSIDSKYPYIKEYIVGEENGNPLQNSCLENSID